MTKNKGNKANFLSKLSVWKSDIMYLSIGFSMALLYYLAYSNKDSLFLNYNNYIAGLYLAALLLLVFKFKLVSIYSVLPLGLLFRVIVFYFSFEKGSFIDAAVFNDIIGFLGYFSIKSFTYFSKEIFYIFPTLSFVLDGLIFVFVYYILKFYAKDKTLALLLCWNPLWITSIYVYWNPLLVYVFFLFLCFFVLLYRQRLVGAIALSFVFGFYDLFYIFLPMSIYSLRGSFLMLLLVTLSLLNVYIDFIVKKLIYADAVKSFIDYLSFGLTLSFDNILLLLIISFLIVSWFWILFLKISFLDKMYISLFALILIYPPLFSKGLSLVLIVLGALYMNFGFLLLSLYAFVLPSFSFSFDIYIQYILAFIGGVYMLITFLKKRHDFVIKGN